MTWHDEHVKRIESLTEKAQELFDCPVVTSKNQRQLEKIIDWIAEECSNPDPENENYIRWLATQPLSDPENPIVTDNVRELNKIRNRKRVD